MKTVFIRVLEELEDKQRALEQTIADGDAPQNRRWISLSPASFRSLPRSPFAYWLTDGQRRLFSELPSLGSPERVAASGGKTLDDFRWVRLAWEARPTMNSGWVDYAKGGAYAPFYADLCLRLDWRNEARALKAYLVDYRSSRGWSPNWTAELHGSAHYFRPGLTWSRRTKSPLSLRVMPHGCVFGDKGPALLVENDDARLLLALLAMGQSKVFAALVEVQLAAADAKKGGAARSYEVGVLQRTPVPTLTESQTEELGILARRGWRLNRLLDTCTETSHAFVLPALVGAEQAGSLHERAQSWRYRVRELTSALVDVQSSIDALCFSLYDLTGEDRLSFEGAQRPTSPPVQAQVPSGSIDEGWVGNSLLSWLVGVIFGRFDVRLANGERSTPPEPAPFTQLPACSPGMLTGEDGLPLDEPPDGYPVTFPEDGVFVDDVGHGRDLVAVSREAFDVVFGQGDADALWDEAAELVSARKKGLRDWFARSFFADHLKRYSKSRRKAPIYWQLATPSASYSIWLYAHRLTPDTFFRVLNNYVAPKLMHEEVKFTRLVQAAGPDPSTRAAKEIATQEAFVDELRAFRDEVALIAPLWNPDLDDGTVLVKAPLWRLVPQHKPWQNELRKKWDELQEGKYDWAHIAIHLWPERVVPKCTEDRSLAIAHDVEDVFWFEDDDGKWQPREVDQAKVDALVEERTSPTVKDALQRLLEAPRPKTSRRRGRKKK